MKKNIDYQYKQIDWLERMQLLIERFFEKNTLLYQSSWLFWNAKKKKKMNMRYDKNGLPVREYYAEELKKSPEEKIKALKYQKYYTGGSIILMFLVLIGMYLVLN